MTRPGGGRFGDVPCAFCPAKDARDFAHRAGCPTLADLSRAELVAIARNVEKGWERGWGGGKTQAPRDAFDRMGEAWRDKTGIAMRARGAGA